MRRIILAFVALCSFAAVAYAIKILPAIRFDRGSAVVRKDNFEAIDDVADTMKKTPDLLIVEVQGHCSTDDAPTKAKLLELSVARANAVRDRIISLGVLPSRVTAVGYADTALVDKKRDQSSQSKNRRIDFVILKRKTN